MRRRVVVAVVAALALSNASFGQAPRPQFRDSVKLEPVSGEVFVTSPDGNRFPLQAPTNVPTGSTVDAREGKTRLIVENKQGELESSTWAEGRFRIVQLQNGITSCHLRGGLVEPAAVRRRRLWGDGKGRFRTRGRFGAATVRGTKWLTEDRPGGTLFLVRRGSVRVRDFVRRQTIVLHKGERYFARKRSPKQSRR